MISASPRPGNKFRRKGSTLFQDNYFSSEGDNGCCKCLLCERQGKETYILYRNNTRTDSVHMNRHLKEEHSIILNTKASPMTGKKESPLSADYDCKVPLDLAIDVALNIKSLRYFRKNDYRHKENATGYVPYTPETVAKGVVMHANRVHRALLKILKGDISISVDGSKLKTGDNIYVVTALKGGKSYYLAGIMADEVADAEYLAVKLQALIAELADNDIKVISIVTDNARNLVKACSYLEIPRQACVCHALNLVMKDILPEIKLREICSAFRDNAKASNQVVKIPEYVATRWFSTVPVLEYLLTIHYLLDKQSFAFVNTILPLFTELQSIIGKLEANDATLLDAWHYLIKLLPKYGHIEVFAKSYNKRFSSQFNSLYAMDVMVYLTSSYDLQKDLENFDEEYKKEFSFERMWPKIDYLAKCWGIEIPKTYIEVYHEKKHWFEARTPISNNLMDEHGDRIDHAMITKKYLQSLSLEVLMTIAELYRHLMEVPVSEASAERVFSALKRAIGTSAYRSSYSLLQSKIILASAERTLYPEIYDQINEARQKNDFSALYNSCYVFKPLEHDVAENEFGFKTPLNSSVASSKNYDAEARTKVMIRVKEADEEAAKHRKATQSLTQDAIQYENHSSDIYESEFSERETTEEDEWPFQE